MFAVLFIIGTSKDMQNPRFLSEPGERIEAVSFKVFQVLDKDAALVMVKSSASEFDYYEGAVYYLTNKEGKFYYDDEIIKVPEGAEARTIGYYRYKTRYNFEKTVPVIMLMRKKTLER
jgi:hypothetical protein